jgi:5-methylthioadenosine/S-adenosylhomocysteine deaminase
MNVRHTIVDGDVLMQDRELLTVDEEIIRQEARDYAKRIREFLAENPVGD